MPDWSCPRGQREGNGVGLARLENTWEELQMQENTREELSLEIIRPRTHACPPGEMKEQVKNTRAFEKGGPCPFLILCPEV